VNALSGNAFSGDLSQLPGALRGTPFGRS
jgi:hypothetical protein